MEFNPGFKGLIKKCVQFASDFQNVHWSMWVASGARVCVCMSVCVRACGNEVEVARQTVVRPAGRAAHVVCSAPSHSRLLGRDDELTRNFLNV